MAARTALLPIIAELRRRVRDMGPEDLDSGVQYVGDVIRLTCTYKNLASAATTPTTPRVNIYDPAGTQRVTTATTVNVSTGVERYDYDIPTAGPEGTWRAEFTGVIDGATSAYTEEFDARIRQRTWTDDELQRYLDIHSEAIEEREELKHDAAYKEYFTDKDTFESAVLWGGSGKTADAISSTAYTANLTAGRWTFSSARSTTLYVDGIYHNTYLAAAEMLFELSGDPSRSFRWGRGAVQHESVNPLTLAKQYYALGHRGGATKLNKVY
jgi:hypothetical protein